MSQAPTYTAGLDYKPSRNALLYFVTRRGYRAGGQNGEGPNTVFSPEYVTDYEVGSKLDVKLAGMPLRLNTALYYQDYTNIQVQQQIIFQNTPISITSNGATARQWGAEIEAQLNVTDRLQLAVNYDHLNFKYKSVAPGVDLATLELSAAQGRPPNKFSASASYLVPIAPRLGSLSIQANYAWQATSGNFLDPVGGITPAFSLLNVSADWKHVAGSPIDLSVYMSNVGNKLYSLGGFGSYASLGYELSRYGDPRLYGFRIRYNF